MRMWMIDPKKMCRNHLLGEHNEVHMLVGTIKKNKSIKGYVKNNLVETKSIKQRHDELAKEIEARGWNHASPLEYNDELNLGIVHPNESEEELLRRCPDCRRLYENACCSKL